MNVDGLLSQRKKVSHASWFIVYEWEDVIARLLGIPFEFERSCAYNKFIKRLPFLSHFLYHGKKTFLTFDMQAACKNSWKSVNLHNNKHVIPIIIDFFLKPESIPAFDKAHNKNSLVLISSKEAYEFLKANGSTLNLAHWGLSISDKYKITPETRFEKKYDLILMGRPDAQLIAWLHAYCLKYPDFKYVERRHVDGSFIYYSSDGERVGTVDTREDYIQFMRSARIGFYSTPGINDTEGRANGFNQVTPRFLELIACGCHIIARYPHNPDTDLYQMSRICPNTTTYEMFEEQMNKARNTPVDMKLYVDYLSAHYTSTRVKQLTEIIKHQQ